MNSCIPATFRQKRDKKIRSQGLYVKAKKKCKKHTLMLYNIHVAVQRNRNKCYFYTEEQKKHPKI